MDSAGSCYKPTDSAGKTTECMNYKEMGAIFSKITGDMMQNLDEYPQTQDANGNVTAKGDLIIDYVQDVASDGTILSSMTCPDGYIDAADLILGCPVGTLCRRSASASGESVDFKLSPAESVDDSHKVPVNRLRNESARVNPQQLLMVDIDGDGLEDWVVATIGSIKVERNSITNVTLCSTESAYGGEPTCGSWVEGPDGQRDVQTKGRCFPDETLPNSTSCGIDFSTMPFSDPSRFSKVTVNEFAGTCVGDTLETGRGCTLRSIKSDVDSIETESDFEFCDTDDTAIFATSSDKELCIPMVPHMAAADFTEEGVDDVIVSRYEYADGTEGAKAEDYTLVLEVITKQSVQESFGGEEFLQPSACGDVAACYTTIPVTLRKTDGNPLDLNDVSGAVVSIAAKVIGEKQTPVVAIGTTTNLYVFKVSSTWDPKNPKIELRQLGDDQTGGNVVESQVYAHTIKQTVTDIEFMTVNGDTSIFWTDYHGNVVRHLFVTSNFKLGYTTKELAIGDPSVIGAGRLTKLELASVGGKVHMMTLGRNFEVANSTDCPNDYKYAVYNNITRCIQATTQLVSYTVDFNSDNVTMTPIAVGFSGDIDFVTGIGAKPDVTKLEDANGQHVIRDIRLGDLNGDNCLDVLVSVDDTIVLVTDGACAQYFAIQRPCSGVECVCGEAGCQTTQTTSTSTATTKTATTSTVTTTTTVFDLKKNRCSEPNPATDEFNPGVIHQDKGWCRKVLDIENNPGITANVVRDTCDTSPFFQKECKYLCQQCPEKVTTVTATSTTVTAKPTEPGTTTTTITTSTTTTTTKSCPEKQIQNAQFEECEIFYEIALIENYCFDTDLTAYSRQDLDLLPFSIELQEMCPYFCGAIDCDAAECISGTEYVENAIQYKKMAQSGRATDARPLETLQGSSQAVPETCAQNCNKNANCNSFSVRTEKTNGDADAKCLLFALTEDELAITGGDGDTYNTFTTYVRSSDCAEVNTGSEWAIATNATTTESDQILAAVFTSLGDCSSVANAYTNVPVTSGDPDANGFRRLTFLMNAVSLDECMAAYNIAIQGATNVPIAVGSESAVFHFDETDPKSALIKVQTCFDQEKADSQLNYTQIEDGEAEPFCENGYKGGSMSRSCSGPSCIDADKATCCNDNDDDDGDSRRRRSLGRRQASSASASEDDGAKLEDGAYFQIARNEEIMLRRGISYTDENQTIPDMTPGMVLIPVKKGDEGSTYVSKSTMDPETVANSAVANPLTAIADADGDGDMDIIFVKSEEYIDPSFTTWTLSLARNDGDKSAGRCAQLDSSMQVHDDICKECDQSDDTCL
jgi:hypothetical protein